MLNNNSILAERYRLLEKVGEGGVAEVFKAQDERLERLVAIKLLRPQFSGAAQTRLRFIAEAKSAAGLSHPNIVQVFDHGELPDGMMFIVMQFVPGQTMRDLLRQRGRLTVDETLRIVTQICAGLAVAHERGLVHRDIKPGNILLGQNGALLADFGIAKALGATGLTEAGTTYGTPEYISPEQATGAAISPASDVYALGCLLYEALAGHTPFTGDSAAAVVYKHVWQDPQPLLEVAPAVPAPLAAVVMRCLAKDPQQRYHSAAELGVALRDAAGSTNPRMPAVTGDLSAAPGRPAKARTVGPSGPAVAISSSATSSRWRSSIRPALLGAALLFIGGSLWLAQGPATNRVTPVAALATATPTVFSAVLALEATAPAPTQTPLVIVIVPTASAAPTVVAATPTAQVVVAETAAPSPTTDSGQYLIYDLPATITPLPTDTAAPATATPAPPEPTNTPVKKAAKPTQTKAPRKPAPTNTTAPQPTATELVVPSATAPAPLAATAVTVVSDARARIQQAIDNVIAHNPQDVADYLAGKKTSLLKLGNDLRNELGGKLDGINFNDALAALKQKLDELR